MTETEHLIHQAAREIGITANQEITVKADHQAVGTYLVTFKNRKGDDIGVEILMASEFKKIHDQLKAAWKGKDNGPQANS